MYQEKTLEEILHRPVDLSQHQPGDRDDNLWITIDQYSPPKSEDEWEQTCFLDKSYHGYYQWPKVLRYPMNKRNRYTAENMPDEVMMIYRRFIDEDFLRKAVQWMVDGERNDRHSFDLHRFRMFKVKLLKRKENMRTIRCSFQGLFRNFGSVFLDRILDQCYRLIRDKSKTQEAGHSVASQIISGLIRGSKHWTLSMVSDGEVLCPESVLFFLFSSMNYGRN